MICPKTGERNRVQIKDKIIVVTGAASGIGKALAERFHKEGAKLVVCSDLNGDGAAATAKDVKGVSFKTDVSKEEDIQHLIDTVEKDHGPIDLFFSNAGIGYLTQNSAGQLDTSGVFAALFALMIVTTLLNEGLGRLENWIFRWR